MRYLEAIADLLLFLVLLVLTLPLYLITVFIEWCKGQ